MPPDTTSPAPPPPGEGDADQLVGGRFRLRERIGAGGMGEVFTAEQLPLGRTVAVKLLTVEFAQRADAAARFTQEARALCSVDDEHVLRVIDFGEDEKRGLFLVTDFLPGELLSARLERRGALPPAEAAELSAQILAGLAAAHDAGVVHRDLKPDNVMLVRRPDGREVAKLLDFGIAKFVQGPRRADLTEAGVFFGTPQWLAPEQALGRSVDHRADLYSCGAILFRMLAGSPPFEAPTPGELVVLHATQPAPPVPSGVAPAALAAVVARALEKAPDARFPDARRMRTAILDAAQGLTRPELPTPTAETPAGALVVPPTAQFQSPGEAALTVASPAALAPIRAASRAVLALGFRDPAPTERPALPPLRRPRGPADVALATVAAFGGQLLHASAEGAVASFGSPTDTLHCAAALVDALHPARPGAGPRAHVRAGVAAGELDPRMKGGPPVTEAVHLCARAAEGQVLFTHAAYLSATRSELAFAEVDPHDPTIRQRVYRLDPRGAKLHDALPFGGDRLARAAAVPPGALLRLAGADLLHLLRALALHGLHQARTRPAPVAAGVGALLLLTVVVALLAGRDPLAGQIEEALAEKRIEQARTLAERGVREAPEDAEAHARLGRALAAATEFGKATDAFAEALRRDDELADDAVIAKAIVACLGRGWAKGTRELILAHPKGAIVDELAIAAIAEHDGLRRNAQQALREMGKLPRATPVAIRAFEREEACPAKARLARIFLELGDGALLPALQDAKEALAKTPEPKGCGLTRAVDAALAKIPPAAE